MDGACAGMMVGGLFRGNLVMRPSPPPGTNTRSPSPLTISQCVVSSGHRLQQSVLWEWNLASVSTLFRFSHASSHADERQMRRQTRRQTTPQTHPLITEDPLLNWIAASKDFFKFAIIDTSSKSHFSAQLTHRTRLPAVFQMSNNSVDSGVWWV